MNQSVMTICGLVYSLAFNYMYFNNIQYGINSVNHSTSTQSVFTPKNNIDITNKTNSNEHYHNLIIQNQPPNQ